MWRLINGETGVSHTHIRHTRPCAGTNPSQRGGFVCMSVLMSACGCLCNGATCVLISLVTQPLNCPQNSASPPPSSLLPPPSSSLRISWFFLSSSHWDISIIWHHHTAQIMSYCAGVCVCVCSGIGWGNVRAACPYVSTLAKRLLGPWYQERYEYDAGWSGICTSTYTLCTHTLGH